jgi:hypothetical protein
MSNEPSTFNFYIQVTPVKGSDTTTRGSTADKIRKLTESQLDHAFTAIEAIALRAGATLENLRAQPERQIPSVMELEFGLSFNTELQAYVVSANAEANLRIMLSWKAGPGLGDVVAPAGALPAGTTTE